MNSNNKSFMIYTASGFRTDIETLIAKFVENNSTKFIVFAQCFRDMYFSLIFRGRHNENEMHEFIDECYLQVLSYLVNTERLESHRIAALYLLYSLYVKQPLDQTYRRRFDFKVRITFDQLLIIRQFISECKAKNYLDVCFVWYKLVAIGVHFVYYRYSGIGPTNTRSCHYWMFQNMVSTDKSVNDFQQSLELRVNNCQAIHDMYVDYKDKVFDGNLDDEIAKPNVIGHELYKDSANNLCKLVNDFRFNNTDFRARGRPSVWTPLRTDVQQMANINSSHNSQDEKLYIKEKTIKSKQKLEKGETSGLLFTEDVKKRIKESKKQRIKKKKNIK